MSVRQFRKTWWIDLRIDGVRHRVRSPENSRAGAAAYEAVLRQKLARGERLRTAGRKLTFPEAATQWFATHVVTNTKPSTQREYRHVIEKQLLPLFGSRPLASITAFDLERLKADGRMKGLSPKSINNCLAVVSRLFRDALAWEWIDKAPRTSWLKVPPQPFDFLAPSESARFLDANRESAWHDMILCALRTGMRLGELLALRWDAVNFDLRTISVSRSIVRGIEGSPKNNRVRHLPMTDDLWDTLARRTHDGPYVFGRAGHPLRGGLASRNLSRACRRIGFRHIGWHVFRHSFASQLSMLGVPLPAIQALLGHSTIQMTMRYSHLMPSTLSAAVARLTAPSLPMVDGQQVGNAAIGAAAPREIEGSIHG